MRSSSLLLALGLTAALAGSARVATAVQGVYVVRASGADGYCDDVLFTGNHGGAIQSCIDRAAADGGGVALVRGGTYSTGTWPLTLKTNVTLRGEGHLGAILAPATSTGIVGTVQDGSAVEGLTLDQTTLSTGKAAVSFGAAAGAHNNVRIENNLFVSTIVNAGNYYGIYSVAGANSFNRIVIRGNMYQAGGTSLAIHYPVYLQISSGQGTMDYVRVESNDFFLNAAQVGTNVTLSAASSTTPSRGIVVGANTMRSFAGSIPFGVAITGAYDAQVTGNAIQALTNTVYVAAGAAVPCSATVTGNNLRGSKPYVGTCTDSVVTGNTDDRANLGGQGKVAVAVRAYRSGNQTFTAGSGPVLVFNTEDVDTGGNFNTSTGTFLAPNPGLYRVRACARFAITNFAAGDTADVGLIVNGATWAFNRVVSGGSTSFHSCVEDLVVLAAGASLQATVDASGSANTRTVSGTGKYSSFISIERISD